MSRDFGSAKQSAAGRVQVFAAGVLAGLVSILVGAGLDSVLEDLPSLAVEVAGADSFLAASLYFSLR